MNWSTTLWSKEASTNDILDTIQSNLAQHSKDKRESNSTPANLVGNSTQNKENADWAFQALQLPKFSAHPMKHSTTFEPLMSSLTSTALWNQRVEGSVPHKKRFYSLNRAYKKQFALSKSCSSRGTNLQRATEKEATTTFKRKRQGDTRRRETQRMRCEESDRKSGTTTIFEKSKTKRVILQPSALYCVIHFLAVTRKLGYHFSEIGSTLTCVGQRKQGTQMFNAQFGLHFRSPFSVNSIFGLFFVVLKSCLLFCGHFRHIIILFSNSVLCSNCTFIVGGGARRYSSQVLSLDVSVAILGRKFVQLYLRAATLGSCISIQCQFWVKFIRLYSSSCVVIVEKISYLSKLFSMFERNSKLKMQTFLKYNELRRLCCYSYRIRFQ